MNQDPPDETTLHAVTSRDVTYRTDVVMDFPPEEWSEAAAKIQAMVHQEMEAVLQRAFGLAIDEIIEPSPRNTLTLTRLYWDMIAEGAAYIEIVRPTDGVECIAAYVPEIDQVISWPKVPFSSAHQFGKTEFANQWEQQWSPPANPEPSSTPSTTSEESAPTNRRSRRHRTTPTPASHRSPKPAPWWQR